MGEQSIFLTLDEGARDSLEPAVLALADGVERFGQVTQDVELVEQDRRLRCVATGRGTISITARRVFLTFFFPVLIAPVVFLEPNMMGGVLIYGFAAAVLGGLTSPFGAVVGGFLVGIFENLAGTYIPGVGNELKLPIALALIITVLVVKPAGLFGRPIVKRV